MGSPTVIGLFAGSVAALVIFVLIELRVKEPVLPIRLFANPVFAVCCVLSFVVGFAMLGAMTFLPTFMQFVDGVSATTSGLRTLPMVVGLLITSMGSGVIVGRTGRYKIFPLAGTVFMCVGFVLLSRMDSATSLLMQSLFLFVLGTGIGMCQQVLVLIVQNTVDFADLGVATSGVTFFRTIGSSFGAAVFGSLFTNCLGHRIGAALVASGAPPAAARSPQVLHHLPHQVARPIIDAYAQSLDLVFLFAAPVAVVGFIVALTLKEVPLRGTAAAVDLGEGFAMPASESPDKLLEMAIGRMVRHGPPAVRLRAVCARGLRAGCRRNVGASADLPLRAGLRDGPAARHGGAAADPARSARAHLRSSGRIRVRPTGRRHLVADPGRPSTSRFRLQRARRLDRRQAREIADIRGQARPRRGLRGAGTHRAPGTGATRLARRPRTGGRR